MLDDIVLELVLEGSEVGIGERVGPVIDFVDFLPSIALIVPGNSV